MTLDVLCFLASYDRRQSTENNFFLFSFRTVLCLKPDWCFLNIILLKCLDSSVKIDFNIMNEVNLFNYCFF